MFGDISAWFYQELAGIHADMSQPGFKHFLVRPRLVDGLDSVDATHESPYGPIQVKWARDTDHSVTLMVHVPVNTTATICIPTGDPQQVDLYMVDGAADDSPEPLDRDLVMRDPRTGKISLEEPGYLVVHVGSGSYRFRAK